MLINLSDILKLDTFSVSPSQNNITIQKHAVPFDLSPTINLVKFLLPFPNYHVYPRNLFNYSIFVTCIITNKLVFNRNCPKTLLPFHNKLQCLPMSVTSTQVQYLGASLRVKH